MQRWKPQLVRFSQGWNGWICIAKQGSKPGLLIKIENDLANTQNHLLPLDGGRIAIH